MIFLPVAPAARWPLIKHKSSSPVEIVFSISEPEGEISLSKDTRFNAGRPQPRIGVERRRAKVCFWARVMPARMSEMRRILAVKFGVLHWFVHVFRRKLLCELMDPRSRYDSLSYFT